MQYPAMEIGRIYFFTDSILNWNLCQLPEDYPYSSAKFYTFGIDEFNIMTHWKDRI